VSYIFNKAFQLQRTSKTWPV